MEKWKDIPGYEGLYQASSDGRIRTVEGKTTSSARFDKRVWKSRIMKGRGHSPSGYRVTLWKDGEVREFLVHRLVALAFLGEPPPGHTVNHKDVNRFNNSVDNLEWMSLRENIRYGFENGQYPTRHIILNDGDNYLIFPSFASCSRFLGKGSDYTSNRIKAGRKTLSDGKTEYSVVSVSDWR